MYLIQCLALRLFNLIRTTNDDGSLISNRLILNSSYLDHDWSDLLYEMCSIYLDPIASMIDLHGQMGGSIIHQYLAYLSLIRTKSKMNTTHIRMDHLDRCILDSLDQNILDFTFNMTYLVCFRGKFGFII